MHNSALIKLRELSIENYQGDILFSDSKLSCVLTLDKNKLTLISFSQNNLISSMLDLLFTEGIIPNNLSRLIREKICKINILKEFLIRENFLVLDKYLNLLNKVVEVMIKSLFLSPNINSEVQTLQNNKSEYVKIKSDKSISHFILDLLTSEDKNINSKTTNVVQVIENVSAHKKINFDFNKYKNVSTYLSIAIVFFLSYKLVYFFISGSLR